MSIECLNDRLSVKLKFMCFLQKVGSEVRQLQKFSAIISQSGTEQFFLFSINNFSTSNFL